MRIRDKPQVGRDTSCPTLHFAGISDITPRVQEHQPHIPGALADLVPQPLPWGACSSAWPPPGGRAFLPMSNLNFPDSFTPFPCALNIDVNIYMYPDYVLLKHLWDSFVNKLKKIKAWIPFASSKHWLKSNSYQQRYNINSCSWLFSDSQSSLNSGLTPPKPTPEPVYPQQLTPAPPRSTLAPTNPFSRF